MKTTITLEEFIKEHAELKKQIAALNAKRKDMLKFAKSIARIANKLYIAGNNNFYFDDETGTHTVSKKIPSIMDDLEYWRTIDIDIA